MTAKFVLLALLFTTVLNIGIAQAHGVEVLRSVPADKAVIEMMPDQIVAQFSEELDPTHSTLEVFDAQGNSLGQRSSRIDLNDVKHATLTMVPPPSLPKGAYTVRWHVTLLDGDASEGQFGFVLGSNSSNSAVASQTTNRFQPWMLWSAIAVVLVSTAGGVFVIKSRHSVD